jgi:DNA-binding PadR family transcriptional regulator
LDALEVSNGIVAEFRRGTFVLAVLSRLESPQYGYSLLQILEDKEFPIDANTLYPLLRRLDKQGLLTSEWNTDEARPRKYYVLSPLGREVYENLKKEWAALAAQIQKILEV